MIKSIVALITAVIVGTALALTGWPIQSPAQTAAAQQPTIWTAQFYNNIYLTGQPVVQAISGPNLTLVWGQNAPVSGIGADYWSARFSTNIYFEAGTYRFFVQADDEVQLWVGSVQQPKLSTIGAPRPGEMLTVDVALNAGWQYVQVDFRENTGLASLFVSWTLQQAGPPPVTPIAPPPVLPPGPVTGSPWLAQYYDNSNLFGLPVVTFAESDPSHNWGTGAPAPGMPADNFSARWTATLLLEGGNYRLSAYADDGVRVFIDNALVINEFHGFLDQVYTRTLDLNAGVHTVVMEYYDATGPAFLDYELTRLTGQSPPPATGTQATVTAWRLNVRSEPNAITGTIITKINRGERYPVVSESPDGVWVQLNVNGTLGWVNSRYVSITGGTAPPPNPPAPSEPMLTTTANLNMRQSPTITADVIGVIPYRTRVAIVGRTANNAWWNVRHEGQTGWVSGAYVILDPQVRESDIRVTG